MGVLGSAGQIYMFVLIALLFLGMGFSLWSGINYLTTRREDKNNANLKGANSSNQNRNSIENPVKKINNKSNDNATGNDKLLRIITISFMGIIMSVVFLGLVSINNRSDDNNHQHQQLGPQQGNSGMNSNMGMYINMQNDMLTLQQMVNNIQMQLNQIYLQVDSMNPYAGNMQMQQNGMNSMGNMQYNNVMNMK